MLRRLDIQFQKFRRIPPSNALQLLPSHHTALLQLLQPPQPILALGKGVVDTIHDPVPLCIPQQASHGVQRPVPARGHPDIRIPHLTKRPRETPPRRYPLDPLQHVGNHFAHVANDDFETGEFIKDACGVQSEDVHGHVAVPAESIREDRGDYCVWERRVVVVVVLCIVGRPGRVQIDGHVEVL